MKPTSATVPQTRELILTTAISVFGRLGFKKTTVNDLAEAAQLSKQGLYLHFSSKQEVFVEAVKRYLDEGLGLTERELTKPKAALFDQLAGAMNAWFGRHLVTFTPDSFDVLEASDSLLANVITDYKEAFRAKLTTALAESSEFEKSRNVCSPKEISQVLFLCGLTWKEGRLTRPEFMKKMALCIRACCQFKA